MLVEKLEEIKQLGAYSVTLHFGEGEGADDIDIPTNDRSVKVVCSPVGYLGSMRAMYVGTIGSLLGFDFKTAPKQISNPPKRDEYDTEGFYFWGSESAIENMNEDGKLFKMQ